MSMDPEPDSSNNTDETLERVLERLEDSLQVDLIATWDPYTCSSADQASAVLADPRVAAYDHLPVTDGGRVVGVLERKRVAAKGASPVSSVMRPLDDSMVISAATGLLSYIDRARESDYHLVLRGHGIRGIVTPSDLLKIPVRTVLFTLITHLETSMARAIGSCFSDDSWIDLLSKGRRSKLRDELEKLEEDRREPDMLLLTQFCDKGDILAKKAFDGRERTSFRKEIGSLEKLRNQVMHSSEYPPDAGYLYGKVESAKSWIARLDGMS